MEKPIGAFLQLLVNALDTLDTRSYIKWDSNLRLERPETN